MKSKHYLKNPCFAPNGRQCRGSQSTLATLVLAGILVGALISAQILVMRRNLPPQVIDNAARLLEKISQEGLAAYIRKPEINFYLIERDDDLVGYSIEAIRSDENNTQFRGRDFSYFDNTSIQNQYIISNDLSQYTINEERVNTREGISETFRMVRNDKVLRITGQVSFSGTTQPLGFRQTETIPENLIPPPLLGLFVGMLRDETFERGAAFLYPYPEATRQGVKLKLPACWVRKEGAIPGPVKNRYPQGYAMQTRWYGIAFKQNMLFDYDKQLLWSENIQDDSREIIRRTTLTELLSEFPEAQNNLKDQFGDYEIVNQQEIL